MYLNKNSEYIYRNNNLLYKNVQWKSQLRETQPWHLHLWHGKNLKKWPRISSFEISGTQYVLNSNIHVHVFLMWNYDNIMKANTNITWASTDIISRETDQKSIQRHERVEYYIEIYQCLLQMISYKLKSCHYATLSKRIWGLISSYMYAAF